MTSKNIESEFSERLLTQMKQAEFPLNLGLKAPIIDFFPPKVIWAMLQVERNIKSEIPPLPMEGFTYEAFENVIKANEAFPEVSYSVSGRPYEIYKFLNSDTSVAVIDFNPLGAIVISRDALRPLSSKTGPLETILGPWITYALSPELWSASGKWPRFHERLHATFEKANLLIGDDFPGYYQLKKEAKKLELHGFLGSSLENSYLLVLPWSFSLTSLGKLEEVIQQEF